MLGLGAIVRPISLSGVYAVTWLLLEAGVCVAHAGEIPREPLDALWESHMLAGTSVMYSDGERSDAAPWVSFEGADGKPDTVWATKQGIRVQDFRETRLGGLLTKGGWRIEGGLLSRATDGSSTIELYGRSVWHVEPALLHFGKAPPRSAEHSYDFFLLRRPPGGANAVIMKQWTIPADRIPYDYYLRGRLEFDLQSRVATVRVTGAEDGRSFLDDRVDVPD